MHLVPQNNRIVFWHIEKSEIHSHVSYVPDLKMHNFSWYTTSLENVISHKKILFFQHMLKQTSWTFLIYWSLFTDVETVKGKKYPQKQRKCPLYSLGRTEC